MSWPSTAPVCRARETLVTPIRALPNAATKLGAIVGGQTSCKDPEIKAFEDHLPADVDIVSCHSLHGPGVDSKDQPLVSSLPSPALGGAERHETIAY